MELLIPPDLDFANLGLRRLPDGSLTFQAPVLDRVAKANGLPAPARGDLAVEIILVWYRQHLAAGGVRDAVVDHAFTQMAAETAFGPDRVIRGPVDPQ